MMTLIWFILYAWHYACTSKGIACFFPSFIGLHLLHLFCLLNLLRHQALLILATLVRRRFGIQNSAVQPLSCTNPFGTLLAMPQISIGHSGIASSIPYGFLACLSDLIGFYQQFDPMEQELIEHLEAKVEASYLAC
ncbi:hypothetical protein U1Q18_021045 [Sarracenia purpurea var. burkii]